MADSLVSPRSRPAAYASPYLAGVGIGIVLLLAYAITGRGLAFSIDKFARCMNQRPVGAVRLSVGLANNEADVRRGVAVVTALRDQNFMAKAT